MGTKTRILAAIVPLAVVILIPVVMRRGNVVDDPSADQLVIISPHNESIRYEFTRAFCAYYHKKTGRKAAIDWRTPGGTSDIVRYIDSAYTSAFREDQRQKGKPWNPEIEAGFKNHKLKKDRANPQVWQARQDFLASNVGIGIDLFFGGGQYDFGRFAAMGFLVPGGVKKRHPDWFSGNPPIISPGMSGEIWTDSRGRYYGACLSSFGICYNIDRMAVLGITKTGPGPVISQWADLARPRLFGEIGVADPAKSGSITKCFEMLIQQQMAETMNAYVARAKKAGRPVDTAAALAAGWSRAMLLIREIGGNARYFTFSASKVPLDVARGDIAAGMCIDFYGRSQAEWEERHVGRLTMRYLTPVGGSSVSADPIALFRGAPHPKIAAMFLDFVLSKQGQRLWNYRVGVPGGPKKYALRRLPIRRDVYTPEDRRMMSDGDEHPFKLAEQFTYHPAWTARLFGLIRVLIRVMTIDCQDELRHAWKAVLDAGGPDRCPRARQLLAKLPFPYSQAGDISRQIQNPERRVELEREWTLFFRRQYKQAANAADRVALAARSRN